MRTLESETRDAEDICKAIVRYVHRTGERVILDDACQEGVFKDNPEVQAMQLRSVLCLPVVKQSKMIGILYLENRLADAVFTSEKTQMTELLTSQAAISLENARLVEEMRKAEAEIRRLNEDLERRASALEASNKELEAFSYSVSHDLRAPLRTIDGFSRILLEECAPQLTPDALQYLQYVHEGSLRMSQLIDGLLSLSRLGRQALAIQTVAPATLVSEALKDLGADQEARHVEIVVGDLPVCQADPRLLKQVFANLLSNALKFTARAGPGAHRGGLPGGKRRTRVLCERQRRGLRHAVRRQALRRVPTAAPRRGLRGDGRRAGHRAAHHPSPWRPHLGRVRDRQRRRLLFQCGRVA